MEKYKNELDIKGWTIIPDVLSPPEIDSALTMFKNWQQKIVNHDSMHEKINPHGIYKFHEVGHTDYAWFIRTRPAVKEAFKHIWSCDKLISSFDGSCFISKNNKKKDTCWTHTDQAPNKKGVNCYQGFVSLTDNKERTLVVYEGSHNLHEKYFSDKGIKSSKNWHKNDPAFLESIKDTRKTLDVPAGSLVLWESRVFHQNQYGKPESEDRYVQYVCMFPDNHPKNTAAIQRKRHKYFKERRTTSHWPAPICVNGLQPQTFGDKTLEVDYEKIEHSDLSNLEKDITKLL